VVAGAWAKQARAPPFDVCDGARNGVIWEYNRFAETRLDVLERANG
jgi:hypothetical protein